MDKASSTKKNEMIYNGIESWFVSLSWFINPMNISSLHNATFPSKNNKIHQVRSHKSTLPL